SRSSPHAEVGGAGGRRWNPGPTRSAEPWGTASARHRYPSRARPSLPGPQAPEDGCANLRGAPASIGHKGTASALARRPARSPHGTARGGAPGSDPADVPHKWQMLADEARDDEA